MRNLFNFRFDKGEGLRGHTLGNLIMMALSDIKGGQLEAIAAAAQIFDVRGRIVPVTLDLVKLTVEYDNGNVVQGEHYIDEPAAENIDAKISKLFVSPHAPANPQVLQVLSEADFIIMGPGDLYTSTLANVIVDDIPGSIRESPARFIFVSNLMTKKGETHWMKASDMVAEVQKYCTREPDVVLVNNARIPSAILAKYRLRKEYLIPDNLPESDQIIRADLISNFEVVKDKGDDLPRSLIRHDAGKLAKLLYALFQQKA